MIRINESDTKQLNIFQDKTGISYYDDMMSDKQIKGTATKRDYYKFEKGADYFINYMTAREYMNVCSDKIFNGRNAYNGVDEETVEEYAEAMRNGDKFPLPYINIDEWTGQEGRHRMLAGAKAFGEDVEFPVMVVFKAEPTIEEIDEYCKKAYGEHSEWAKGWISKKFGFGEEEPEEPLDIY